MRLKFFKCETCGNIIMHVKESGVSVICCGKKMEELIPGAVEAAQEKHIPEVQVEKNIVKVMVGSVPHPMMDQHYIEWIALETENNSIQLQYLKPGESPECSFALQEGVQPKTVYAYCNLHGLWKKEI